jgi:hypothetical protein
VMIRSILLAGLVAAIASPAAAQPGWADRPAYPSYYEGLPTRTVMRIVRSRGLTPVGRPRRHGGHYLVPAEDELGRMRRVVIDARSGRLLRVEAVGREFGGPRTFAMRPPRSVPNARRHGGDGMGPRIVEPRRRLPPLRPPEAVDEAPEAESAGEPPPMPPQASLPADAESPAVITTPENSGPQALPAPPTPEPRVAPAQKPAAGAPRPRRASVNPANPPIPRPRPAAAPETTGATGTGAPPAAAGQEGAGHGQKGLPRVVLPGGPLPKTERTADTRPGTREDDASKPGETSAAPAQPAAESQERSRPTMPPVQGLE